MSLRRASAALVAFVMLGCGFSWSSLSAGQQQPPQSWLDRPLVSWNRPGIALPKAPPAERTREELSKECDRPLLRDTAAERAVTGAGWASFRHFDRQLLQNGVEIVDGMA